MSKNSTNTYLICKILGSILILIIIIIGIGYKIMHSQLSHIVHQEKISFQTCKDYIFSAVKSREIKIQEYINENDYKVLDLKCFNLFPNKRESFITTQEFSNTIMISEKNTKTEIIDIPENVLLDKSKIDIEFKIPKPNITLDVTFFGYSLGKIQNRDGTTRIGATHQNIINESFTLEDIYYDENPEFIITNLMGNDMQVSYHITYYIENY